MKSQRIAFKDLGITSTPWKKSVVKQEVNIEPHQIECGQQDNIQKRGHIFSIHYPGILERCVACKVYKYKWVAFKQGKKVVEIINNDIKKLENEELD